MRITKEILRSASTKKGGYTGRQIKVAQKVFPGKWKSKMIGADVDDEFWQRFVNAVGKKGKFYEPKINKKIINEVSVNTKDDWAWKPVVTDIPKIKIKGKHRGKNKQNRWKSSKADSECFYRSKEWRKLRTRVLEKYECKCMMCGRSPKDHGIVIHIDHIKPRSKHPELSLDFDNLQILCEDCNLGKLNRYDTDWRPALDENEKIDAALDIELLSSSPI